MHRRAFHGISGAVILNGSRSDARDDGTAYGHQPGVKVGMLLASEIVENGGAMRKINSIYYYHRPLLRHAAHGARQPSM